jgi:hypothetical protein
MNDEGPALTMSGGLGRVDVRLELLDATCDYEFNLIMCLVVYVDPTEETESGPPP